MVAFLLTLTDERTTCERDPFDHPSIDVPNGPSITAVGEDGRDGTRADPCVSVFLDNDPFAQ